MIRGGGDFLLRLVARDTMHENQLTQRLTGLPTVTRVQTLQTIRTSRSLAGVPL
ncbi:MAG: Lrp/AsnC family transcriptional regulator, partial [Acetobacteraceae bacterium]